MTPYGHKPNHAFNFNFGGYRFYIRMLKMFNSGFNTFKIWLSDFFFFTHSTYIVFLLKNYILKSCGYTHTCFLARF